MFESLSYFIDRCLTLSWDDTLCCVSFLPRPGQKRHTEGSSCFTSVCIADHQVDDPPRHIHDPPNGRAVHMPLDGLNLTSCCDSFSLTGASRQIDGPTWAAIDLHRDGFRRAHQQRQVCCRPGLLMD